MKSKLGLVLILSALILSSCGPTTAQPTEVVVTIPVEATPIPEGPEVTEFTTAYSAARAYISEHYGEQLPPWGLGWTTEPITLEGPVDSMGYQYTTDDWVVTVTCPIAGPKRVVYRVRVANETTGFRWEGHVDGEGHVSAASEDVLAARDAALAYISEQYGEQAPGLELTWMEELTSPELVPGGISYRFTAEDWVITIDTTVVPPEMRVYRMSVSNPTTGFWWEGRIDAEGRVTEGPEIVLTARGAALNYISEHYGEQAPPPELTWEGGRTTPEGLAGGETFQYTADDWVITVSFPLVAPHATIYQVAVANQTTGFQWQGEVDATGQVADRLAPEEVRAARDAALAYVTEHYGEQAPAPGLTWGEERTTPEGLVGLETFEFTAGDWVVTISYPVVAPEAVVYQVVVASQAAGFQWEGEVDAAGQVTELYASTEPVLDIRDPGRALDVALAYINEHYGEQAPAPGLTWTGNQPPPEEPVGGETIEFTSESAPDWVVTVSYGVVAPEAVVYQVAVTNQTTGFRWEGEVDATGQVTELSAPTAGQPVACWYGRVESTPDDPPYDDYLVLLPEELRRAVGLAGADEAVEAEIEGLRDSGTYAHFWGTLACDVPDYGGCQLVVTRLRAEGPEGPFFDPDPVEDWTGSLFSTPDDAQFDDYFVPSGNFRVRYGIDSVDSTIAAQLESLRDTGATIRVWGQVTCPAIDFYGTQIQVTRIEVAREAPAEEEGYEGWNTYMSEKFGYTLRYPGDATVMGANPDESVQFVGPIVNNEHWPWFFVDHYESDFYHPPAGTDVHQWIADSDISCDEIGSEVEVAGLPTVHLIYEGGPGVYARDDYYFIRGDQLFRISILHAGGQQDWDLYNKFLQSFTFP